MQIAIRGVKKVIPKRLTGYVRRVLNDYKSENKYKKAIDDLKVTAKRLPVTDNPEIVVSLTSYGSRKKNTAPFAILSILNQSVLPDRIVLWLAYGDEPPRVLERLKELGLEILYTEDIKSYKKLIPTLDKYPASTIITVDDDILYPQDWLEVTLSKHKQNPGSIIVNRARKITVKDGELLPYNSWSVLEKNIANHHLILPTGACGVLYPPGSFDSRIMNRQDFMSLAEHGDDLWFWAMSELKDVNRVYIEDGFHDVAEYELDKVTGLSATVNGTDNNDKQFAAILNNFPELKGKIGIR